IYGGCQIELNEDRMSWRAMDVSMWKGHSAYIELIDSPIPTLSHGDQGQYTPRISNGYLAVDEIRFADSPESPASPDEPAAGSPIPLPAGYREIEASIPIPSCAPAFVDGPGEDEAIFLRGNHKTLGAIAPRGAPAVCSRQSAATGDQSK